MKRDAETSGNSLESGCTEKKSFHGESPESLGHGVKGNPITGAQLPAGNPSKKVSRGQTLK